MADDGLTTKGVRRRAAPAQAGEGHATDRILDSAEQVLRQHGYAGFTTRRVAEAAGMAPGNLSYHYPTKVELLRALIQRLIANYSKQLRTALQQPEPGLEDLLRWLMGAAVDREANFLFRELWAMALHDEVVRNAVNEFYDQVITDVENTLMASYPAADPQNLRDVVQLLAVISEGSGVIYGVRPSASPAHARLVELAIWLVGVVAPELALTTDKPSAR